MSKPKLNCAIYTRKSSEEGLEQSFNSLDAQREACEAYVTSQKQEGWQCLPTLYDDGGYSGGSMERPALQKLMGDIQAGRVNIIVVYKVDRLTRSLADFAKMVELFDRYGVSFVSVTQQFNTTSSMGRLTLNVLLSFAQFEREVTGERIRDKIAASKAKGMWMGGVVPLGYEAKDRRLYPIPKEAEKVRHIFKRYTELASVWELQAELKAQNVLSKANVSKNGKSMGGQHFGRGALYDLLQNPIYIGQVRHKDKTYEGQHKAIVPAELWQAVQEKLAANRLEYNGKKASHSLLTGLLHDSKGEKLTPVATLKKGKRYRYYASVTTTQRKAENPLRLPATELEGLVLKKLDAHLSELPQSQVQDQVSALRSVDPVVQRAVTMGLIEKIVIYSKEVAIELKSGALISAEYSFVGQGMHRALNDGSPPQASERQTQSLLKSFLQGYVWREKFFSGESTVDEIARAAGVNGNYVTRLINFSLISPKLATNILRGDLSSEVTRERLVYDYSVKWA